LESDGDKQFDLAAIKSRGLLVAVNLPTSHTGRPDLPFNNDGIMEIVFSHQQYEGEWIGVYRVEGTKITLLFGMGCGV
jgi:hypothetical protein